MKIIKSCMLYAILCCSSGISFAQNTPSPGDVKAQISKDGAFNITLRDFNYSPGYVQNEINRILSLPEEFSFVKTRQRTDKNGMIHTAFQQYYKGLEVENGTVLIHSRNTQVVSMNGKIMTAPAYNISTIPAIAQEEAAAIAKRETGILKLINNPQPELVIYNDYSSATLAYKVRIDGILTNGSISMYNVYVDAANGGIIRKLSLIAHADRQASAETFYSGTQQITTDSFSGGYRLKDNARKIETYDVKGQTFNFQSAPAFQTPNEITNNSTNWTKKLYLNSVTLEKAADSIRFTGLYNPMISFTSGWLIRSKIDETAPAHKNIKDEIMMPNMQSPDAVKLPVTQDLSIIVGATQYKGSFRKDSTIVSFNPFTFSLEATTVSFDPNIIEYEINNPTAGTHQWTNVKGDKGSYKVSFSGNPAVDVHWGMGKTYDFYKNTFNYYSYDNDSASVIRNYYDGVKQTAGTQNNAMALPDPHNAMVYGTGDGIQFNPLVALDIEGHEFTHLITARNANLDYQGESGALNESFSDMMGAAIVHYAKGAGAMDWLIGAGVPITAPYMRSFSNPKGPAGFTDTSLARPQPHTYLGQYWADTASSAADNGGVHINSGVGNKWFYLLAHGGSGTNDNQYAYNISPIGIQKAQNIAFTTFTDYLTSTSRYHDAYTNSLQATEDLYGKNSAEYQAVKDAWKAVGIPKEASGIQTGNAVMSPGMEIYPNPSGGEINIKSLLDKPVQVELYDILGRKTIELQIAPGNNNVNLTTLGKGVYFATYHTESSSHTQKVILQ